jgi:hypothetical protein
MQGLGGTATLKTCNSYFKHREKERHYTTCTQRVEWRETDTQKLKAEKCN